MRLVMGCIFLQGDVWRMKGVLVLGWGFWNFEAEVEERVCWIRWSIVFVALRYGPGIENGQGLDKIRRLVMSTGIGDGVVRELSRSVRGVMGYERGVRWRV